MRAVLVTILAGLAGPVLAADLPPVPAYKTFGRWVVACDNVRRCEARGFDDTTRADLRIVRDAGPALPTMTYTWDPAPNPATLRLDGKPLTLPAPAWVRNPAASSVATSDFSTVASAVAQLRDAKTITFGADGTIPLQGFVAALLLMDAVQGRPGTPTALVAPRGKGTAPGTPALPARPTWVPPKGLTDAEAKNLIGRVAKAPATIALRTRTDCDSKLPAEAAALDTSHAIVLMPCTLYAYQSSTLVAIVPRGHGPISLFNAVLPAVPSDSGAGDGLLIAGSFDTGVLSTAVKGRGLADCGMSASWVWHDGAFRLVALSYLDQCGGAVPGDWPDLYRTR
jgi:hypothetical protein